MAAVKAAAVPAEAMAGGEVAAAVAAVVMVA